MNAGNYSNMKAGQKYAVLILVRGEEGKQVMCRKAYELESKKARMQSARMFASDDAISQASKIEESQQESNKGSRQIVTNLANT